MLIRNMSKSRPAMGVKPRTPERLMIDGVDASAIKQEFDNCNRLAKRTARNHEALRKAIYALYRAMNKNQVRLSERQISQHINQVSGCDRSFLNRLLWCAKMEILTNTPQGEMKEYALRELRRICESENWEATIDDAWELAGDYDKITSNHLFEVAKQNGWLKEGVSKTEGRPEDTHERQPSTQHVDRRLSHDVAKLKKPTARQANKQPDDPKIDSGALDRKWFKTFLQQTFMTPVLNILLEDRDLGLDREQRQEVRRILMPS